MNDARSRSTPSAADEPPPEIGSAPTLVVPFPTRSIASLDRRQAADLLAGALAVRLGVPRSERHWTRHVVASLYELRESGELADAHSGRWLGRPRPTGPAVASIEDAVRAAYAVAAWPEPSTPQLALIVAVADEWAALTSRGGPELTHAEALERLDRWAGVRLDLATVQAAAAIIRRERRFSRHPALQPRLHRWRSVTLLGIVRRLLVIPPPYARGAEGGSPLGRPPRL